MLIALARQRLPPIGFSYLLNKIVPWKGEHWVSAYPSAFFMILEWVCSVVESVMLVFDCHCRFISWSQMYGRM